jgi:DNA-binding transcriptional ArsR family regulator
VSQLHYLRAKEIRLGASSYIGAGKTVFGRKHAEMPAETLIVYGQERLPFPFATRDPMEKVAQVFSPLSNVNTIKVLRAVLGKRKLLVDVVRQTRLAIKEASDHISSLESAKLVKTYVEEGQHYVEADVEKVSRIVKDALEKVIKIEAEE